MVVPKKSWFGVFLAKLLADIAVDGIIHDRRMVGVRVNRIELDEVWSFVGKKQKRVKRHEAFAKGDQYTYIALAGTQKAIISYRIGKRDGHNTDEFVQDLRGRVLGAPEISTDGFHPYKLSVRDAFRNSAHGVIVKTLSVTDLRKDAAQPLQPVRSSSGKPRSGSRRPGRNLNQLRRAGQSFDPYGIAAVHATDQRLLKEARMPRGGREPLCRALQLVPRA
jgi:hypothetical protein